MNVVVSQPMYFPWVGMFEQIRLADVYVHYSDVQLSRGSFVNRVQIKTAGGVRWLTVPLKKFNLGRHIDEVYISNKKNWRASHLELLKQAYKGAPFRKEMLGLVECVFEQPHTTIAELSVASLLAVCEYFSLHEGRRFVSSRVLGVGGSSSRRVYDIVKRLGGDCYITGLGAIKYLDHQLFDDAGVAVRYMDYRKTTYPQGHGAFTPYVSILDLIANEGRNGIQYMSSGTRCWREMVRHGQE